MVVISILVKRGPLGKPELQPPPLMNIPNLYSGFDSPICDIDCGEMCRVNNPRNLPFCCDFSMAVPVLFQTEWDHLETVTTLWFPPIDPKTVEHLEAPRGMVLRQCLGAPLCQREFRSLSCRQFPFFPYVSSDYEFLGLAFEWEFKDKCWLIDNAAQVTSRYRAEFIQTYNQMFIHYQDVFDNYYYHSELCREQYQRNGERVLVLHRNGKNYWIDPVSEKKKLAG